MGPTTKLTRVSAGRDITINQGFQRASVPWPVRVGLIPELADCYQHRAESTQLCHLTLIKLLILRGGAGVDLR